MASWTVYIVTDTGRRVPHWTAETRERARAEVRSLRRSNTNLRALIKKEQP